MRRGRSNTLYADNLEDYMDAAKGAESRQSPFMPKKSAPQKLSLEKKFDEDSESHWNDFDFDSDYPNKDASTLPSLTLSDNTVETDCSEEHEKVSVQRKAMVIGKPGSGKHSLFNSVFDCGENVSDRKSRTMDLMTKTEDDEEEGVQARYQFWIQNLFEDELKKEMIKELIKVYYKSASLFMFVYSISDRKSFECLDEAIQSVLDEVGAEKFQAVLLGTKGDLEDEREVDVSEGVFLKEKYQMLLFSETSVMDLSLKEKLIPFMKEKENSLNAKKVLSLLSID